MTGGASSLLLTENLWVLKIMYYIIHLTEVPKLFSAGALVDSYSHQHPSLKQGCRSPAVFPLFTG